MKRIDFENHFFTREYINYIRNRKEVPREVLTKDGLLMWYTNDICSPRSFEIDDRQLDLGEGRLKDMDINGIDIQVLSMGAPSVQSLDTAAGVTWAKRINYELSKIVKRHPNRFVGLACIAPQSPNEAAGELERAEKLDVPMYIHPDIPSTAMLKPYEGIPFWLNRIDFFWLKPWGGRRPKIERKPSDVIKTNFTITTSGMFFQPAFMCTYLALGADRIAFAVDYPYEKTEEAVQFMNEVPICESDKEKIYHLNA